MLTWLLVTPLRILLYFFERLLFHWFFYWKLDHSCLCLEIWRDVTPYRSITVFFSAVLGVNKLRKHSHGRKEGNKSMMVFMSWLWTFHLLLNIHTKSHKNAYISAECIQNKIVCDLRYTNYLLEHLLITPVKSYRMGNWENIITSIFVVWTMFLWMLPHQIWQYHSITYLIIVYLRELIIFQITICS